MDGEANIRLAYQSILDGDYEAALDRFEAAIAADPENADYHYRCSITCARSGKWAKAQAYAEEAVRLDGEHEEYRFHLQTIRARLLALEAEQLLSRESPAREEAIARLEEAVRLDPLLVEAYRLLGNCCGALGRYDDAVAWLRTAIELDPGNAAARRWFADYSRKRRALRRPGNERNKRRKNR